MDGEPETVRERDADWCGLVLFAEAAEAAEAGGGMESSVEGPAASAADSWWSARAREESSTAVEVMMIDPGHSLAC